MNACILSALAAACCAASVAAVAQPNNAVPAVPTVKPTTQRPVAPPDSGSRIAGPTEQRPGVVAVPQIAVQVGRTPSVPPPDSAASAVPPSGVDDRAARCRATDAASAECRDAPPARTAPVAPPSR